jgi:hypothetical protein
MVLADRDCPWRWCQLLEGCKAGAARDVTSVLTGRWRERASSSLASKGSSSSRRPTVTLSILSSCEGGERLSVLTSYVDHRVSFKREQVERSTAAKQQVMLHTNQVLKNSTSNSYRPEAASEGSARNRGREWESAVVYP